MTIDICERCGKTSQDAEAQIATMSVAARQNGNEESSYKGAISVCKQCRANIQDALTKLMTPNPSLQVRVERVRLLKVGS